MSDTTEGKILASIPDLDDNTPDASDDTSNDTSTQTSGDGDATVADGNKPTVKVDGDNSGGGTPNPPAQPTVAPIIRRDGLHEVPNKNDPSTRDLVDPKTGQVVAHGGAERRYFETAQKLHRDNASLTQRLQAAEGNANHANEIVQLGARLELNPANQTAALNLMSQFLKDPVKMLEALVVEVKSKGYEIPFLATGITPGMDTAAIQRMVDARMAPITNANKAQEEQAQAQSNAKITLDKFLDDNPEGEHNLGVLAEMMKDRPGMTINDAFVNLVKWCAKNGFDYSQPIQPQVTARNGQQTTTQQPAANTAQTPPRAPVPLPNGRQTNGAVPLNQTATFDENSSWSDIIKHAAKESGYSSAN